MVLKEASAVNYFQTKLRGMKVKCRTLLPTERIPEGAFKSDNELEGHKELSQRYWVPTHAAGDYVSQHPEFTYMVVTSPWWS